MGENEKKALDKKKMFVGTAPLIKKRKYVREHWTLYEEISQYHEEFAKYYRLPQHTFYQLGIKFN